MKKVRLYFVLAALVLVTAGIFAGKSRLTGGAATNLYFYDGLSGTYILMAASTGLTTLDYSTTETGSQMTVNPNAYGFPATDGLYCYVEGRYYPVYFQ